MANFGLHIGQRVRALRNARSWTLEELGHRSGLKPEAVSRVEREYGRSIESFVVLRRPSQCREKVFRIESIHP